MLQEKNKNQNEGRRSLMLLRIANHHYVHDGVYETGSITFELIPAVVTLSQIQMFKWLLNGDVWDYKYVPRILIKILGKITPEVCLLFK